MALSAISPLVSAGKRISAPVSQLNFSASAPTLTIDQIFVIPAGGLSLKALAPHFADASAARQVRATADSGNVAVIASMANGAAVSNANNGAI
jgi:hypothetical protein